MNYFDVLFAKKQSGGETPTLITKTITENGTYTASEDNADGYSQVTVNVPYMEKKSASGDIASFSDGAGYPFLKVKANINPVQDLHGQDYPWVGGAGKNLAYLEQGSLDLTNGAETPSTTRVRTNFIPVEQLTTYIASSQNNGWSVRNGIGYDENKDYVKYGIFPSVANNMLSVDDVNVKYVRFIYSHADGTEECSPSDYWYQFEKGSTATSYSPYSNICPISGFTGVNVAVFGKNLFDKSKPIQDNYYNNDGVEQTSANTGHSELMPCYPNTYYTLSGTLKIASRVFTTGFYFWDANKNWISRNVTIETDAQTVLTPPNCRYISLQLSTPQGAPASGLQIDTVQVEQGSSATAYEAYNSNSHVYPISWQDEAGIVYGGYIDLVSGVLTKTLEGVDLGTLDWSIYDSALNEFRTTGLTNNKSATSGALSSHYTITSAGFAGMEDGTMRGTSTNFNVWVIRDTRFTDAANFKTAMSGVQLVHELATPQTYQLTLQQINTLIGQNNAWNNTNGQTEVEYFIPIE